jgi:hypothetical protein
VEDAELVNELGVAAVALSVVVLETVLERFDHAEVPCVLLRHAEQPVPGRDEELLEFAGCVHESIVAFNATSRELR